MIDYTSLIDTLIGKAIEEIAARRLTGSIVTIALYFDHASPALSICADTLANSDRHSDRSLAWSYQKFSKALSEGDLKKAARFNHSAARSLSLGDFACVNYGRHELPASEFGNPPDSFFLALATGLRRNESRLLAVCDRDQRIVFACSTASDEVGLFWTLPRLQQVVS